MEGGRPVILLHARPTKDRKDQNAAGTCEKFGGPAERASACARREGFSAWQLASEKPSLSRHGTLSQAGPAREGFSAWQLDSEKPSLSRRDTLSQAGMAERASACARGKRNDILSQAGMAERASACARGKRNDTLSQQLRFIHIPSFGMSPFRRLRRIGKV
jgi:hypothetical protein